VTSGALASTDHGGLPSELSGAPAPTPTLQVIGVDGMPEVAAGDDLVSLTLRAIERAGMRLLAGDVLVFTQKVLSKAEQKLVRLDEVVPSPTARDWAERWGGDARVVELVLREAKRVVRMERGIVITETRHGFVCANSGVDVSNVPEGWAALLPHDPDASARKLCRGLRDGSGARVGVIVSDTFGRPWRDGQIDVAIGVAGVRAILDYRGVHDSQGRPLRSTRIAVADELAAAAELVMGKTRGVPVAIVRGTGLALTALEDETGRTLLRPSEQDLFR
jgi:coenzyme F420-0:L-glutamate ligase/coenzyme F420-1:gamma-L-glutamate ligase